MQRRHTDAAARFEARRQREQEAPRLLTEVPSLEGLRIEIEERRSGSTVAEANHIRRVVIESAPALFIINCGDRDCHDGGHDVTYTVMSSLRRGAARFEGEDVCHGNVRTTTCGRVIRYVGIATYR